MIFDPPAEAITKRTSPEVEFSAMMGEIEDRGRFPGRMKLEGSGKRVGSQYLLRRCLGISRTFLVC